MVFLSFVTILRQVCLGQPLRFPSGVQIKIMSESDRNDVEWVFYVDRPEWKDVQPIPQSDGPYNVVQIAYSDKFRDIFNYFRAVLASREISERALKLSQDAADANPSNYSVWHYRRILLQELKKDLNEELKFISKVIEETPKNYQVWHHRQVLVDLLQDPSNEKDFTAKIISEDPKNYHAWQHRQWVIRKFDLWDGELKFVDDLLEEDIRNNSAWNQRFFIMKHEVGEKVPKEEIEFVLKVIEVAPNNESSWNYLRGILQDGSFSTHPEVKALTDRLYETGCRSPHLLGFIVDLIEEQLLLNATNELLDKVVQICLSLCKEHDPLRREYWKFIGKNLEELYGIEDTSSSFSSDID